MEGELEKLNEKSSWGGARENAGRPLGSQNKATIEKKTAELEFKQRILRNLDKLVNSQLAIAQGTNHVYKIVETGEGSKKKREHILVTDEDEIKEFLDAYEGGSGQMDNDYYYITTKIPDNRAIDSMIDRVFGKSMQPTDITSDGKPIPLLGVIKEDVLNNNGNKEDSQPEEKN